METEELIEEIETIDEEERLRQLRRRERIEEMKRQKERTIRLHRCIMAVSSVLLLFAGLGIGVLARSAMTGNPEKVDEDNSQIADSRQNENEREAEGPDPIGDVGQMENGGQEDLSVSGSYPAQDDIGVLSYGAVSNLLNGRWQFVDDTQDTEPEEEYRSVFTAYSTDATAGFSEDVVSEYGILVDVEEGFIVAARNPYVRMNPASMTKVLTVLTAAEILGIEDEDSPVLEESFTITVDITDYCFVNDCSIAGFEVGEEVSVKDLFYGTILPSGADAAVGLAVFVSGSHEEFVNRMNEKLEELGLSETTHFTNSVGLYDENHYTTAYDMAVILKEAADNAFCRQVLSAHTYTTSPTEQHPEGIWISNLFLRRIEDLDTHGEVLCAKTGYVDESGNCAATLAVDENGREYLCVTARSSSSWRCVYDHTDIYQTFLSDSQSVEE